MAVERAPAGTSLVDVLDRVLDKGIVVDADIRASPGGIDLVTGNVRIAVASVETHLDHARPPGVLRPVAGPVAVEASEATGLERASEGKARHRRRPESAP